ncbi:hypothetical protein BOSE125_120109 [Bosea sp. 125]|nr:hypothetical protein BOSE125_120109 [Bosea sp. 125]
MPFTGGRPFSFAGAEPKQSLARLARSVPPACGGEGLGMGGRKAVRFIRSSKHQAALPPTQPSPPQAGGGLALVICGRAYPLGCVGLTS